MDKHQKLWNDYRSYLEEGLMRVVYETDELIIVCFVNSTYTILLPGIVDKTNNLTVAFGLKSTEFPLFMEEPTLENFRWLNQACLKMEKNRAFTLTPEFMDKIRDLKKKLGGKVEVDLALEHKLVQEAINRPKKEKKKWYQFWK